MSLTWYPNCISYLEPGTTNLIYIIVTETLGLEHLELYSFESIMDKLIQIVRKIIEKYVQG